MKRLWFVPMLLVLTSCGVFSTQEPAKKEPPTTAVVADIIEENKADLNYIKNRTADDLELGHAVRHMIVEQKLGNSEVGSKAREIVLRQPTTPKEAKERCVESGKSKGMITREFFLILLLTVGVCSLIQCLIHYYRSKKNGQS